MNTKHEHCVLIGTLADYLQVAAHHGQPVIRQVLPLECLDLSVAHLEHQEDVTAHLYPC